MAAKPLSLTLFSTVCCVCCVCVLGRDDESKVLRTSVLLKGEREEWAGKEEREKEKGTLLYFSLDFSRSCHKKVELSICLPSSFRINFRVF